MSAVAVIGSAGIVTGTMLGLPQVLRLVRTDKGFDPFLTTTHHSDL